MKGDGDGWTRCGHGHAHWGMHGAAGLLLRAQDGNGTVHVLLQHRAPWSHDGDTWGIPGGARDSHESAADAALREAREEASLDLERVAVRAAFLDDHDGWGYTSVVADADGLLPTVAQRESVALAWVPERDVSRLALHGGFAQTWPRLRAAPARLVVDAANVVGSRPDGWWRDRAGAAARLLDDLARLRSRTVELPNGRFVVVDQVVAVVEGWARAVDDVPGVSVLRADGSGDDAVVRAASQDIQLVSVVTSALDSEPRTVVVTADRGLRNRLPPGAAVAGPRWLLGLTDSRPPHR